MWAPRWQRWNRQCMAQEERQARRLLQQERCERRRRRREALILERIGRLLKRI